MARVTEKARSVQTWLMAKGVALKEAQVQGALDADQGDADDRSTAALSRWAALSALRAGPTKRLPPEDEVTWALAVAGHWTPALPGALHRLRATTDPEGESPEAGARRLMAGASDSEDISARIIRRFRQGSERSGTPWRVRQSGRSGQKEAQLQHEGRVEALLTEFGEAADGAPIAGCVDAADAAAVLGGAIDSESVHAGMRLIDLAFPDGKTRERCDALIDQAEPAALVSAVQAANGAIPLWEALIGLTRTNRERCALGATLTPLMLALGDLLQRHGDWRTQVDAIAALMTLLDRPDRAEHYRSVFGASGGVPSLDPGGHS